MTGFAGKSMAMVAVAPTAGSRGAARPIVRRIFAACLVVVALPLCLGGAYLLFLDGSPYYALAGLATLASGVLTWRGDRSAA